MFSVFSSILALVLLGVLYAIYVVVWRLYWSPIAKFPGPKLAAATHLYELYYELYKGGKYVFKKAELHEKYGPIVRVNPWELHVNDPDFYEELYAGGGRKRDKYWYHTTQFNNSASAFGTNSHDLHRLRRNALNKYFSKASITRLEPLIQSVVDNLCNRLRSFQATGAPVKISKAFSCVSNDVICHYCFAKNYDSVTTAPDFCSPVNEAISELGPSGRFMKQAPWLAPLLAKTPRSVIRQLFPAVLPIFEFEDKVESQIKPIMAKQTSNIDSDQEKSTGEHPTLFHEILNGDLPPQEKTFNRLKEEAVSILGAGTETVGWTLSVAICHIINDRDIHAKLKSELAPVFEKSNGRPTWKQLEQVSYFGNVISEALRLGYGVCGPLPRIATDENLIFKDWIIPAGTPVSMTSVLVHSNPDIFPDPTKFRPERWIDNPKLSKYLVSFNKGSRQCVGMNLAYAELFLCIAYVIMQFPNMKLYETGIEDVEIVSDNFVPGSTGRGVRVFLS